MITNFLYYIIRKQLPTHTIFADLKKNVQYNIKCVKCVYTNKILQPVLEISKYMNIDHLICIHNVGKCCSFSTLN